MTYCLSFRPCGEISIKIDYNCKMKKTIGTHNYYVYILTNKSKTVLYVGITNNLKERLYYHSNPEANSNHFSHKYNCKYVIYFEHYQNIDVAIDREKQIKKWSRKKKEFLIGTKNKEWKFLNDEF
ncbi:GIY-YIG nuclease family protein [Polaribacter sp. R77954]|uniref:GIY-YIG nuclease family protein n=1 Tax=Polaribacter sp. R77954 TaxID=3093870 RepID=UPI0037C9F0BA